MLDDLGSAANQALYGRKKGKAGFGKALYEIKEERRKGTNYVYEKAIFYEEYVVMEAGNKQGCCPTRSQQIVLPKYKMCGARVNKAAKGYSLAMTGIGLIVGGIIVLIMGATGSRSMLTALGAILIVVGLLCLLFPCCMSRYETELTVLVDPDDPALGQKTYTLRTFQKPDDDFILLYVYGCVTEGMAGFHALSHLVDDNLVCKVQPLEMTAISIADDKLPSSNLISIDEKRKSTHATNQGYGKQLYVVEQATGIFGEEGSIFYKLGSSISKTTTRAVFCENLIVLQVEKKLLCYPMTYEKLIIPKYRVANVEFNKGGVMKKLLAACSFIMVIGFILLFVGVGMDRGIGSNLGIEAGGTGLIVGGIFVLVVCIILSIMAMCHSTYEVLLYFIKPPVPPGTNPLTKFLKNLVGPETYSIILMNEPHKEFIMSYVYGTLADNIGGYHCLTHLIKDNLVERVKPFTINGAIAGTGKESFIPVSTTGNQIDVKIESSAP